MKLSRNLFQPKRGLTLIEVTLVISILLSLISVTLIGIEAYKHGSNRAKCIMQASRTQQAIRTFSNLNYYSAGDEVTGLKDRLIGPGKLMKEAPECPANGTYTFGAVGGSEDTIPPIGSIYLQCSLDIHEPADTKAW